jgi:Uma2 family endonuclease
MVTTVTERLLSAEEFARLPDPCDGGQLELIEGRVVEMAPAGYSHGRRSGRIISRLDSFASEHALGYGISESGFLLRSNPDVVRVPDAAFVSTERDTQDSGYFQGAPDLAVEVMSPNDRERDVLTKVGEYLDAGAQRVWVVRAASRTVSVYFAGGDVLTLRAGDALNSDHAGFSVAGFALPLDELFA